MSFLARTTFCCLCGLSTETIEYSCPSVCVCLFVYTITKKIMVKFNWNWNSSDEFDIYQLLQEGSETWDLSHEMTLSHEGRRLALKKL